MCHITETKAISKKKAWFMQSLRGGERLRGTDWGDPGLPPKSPGPEPLPPDQAHQRTQNQLAKIFWGIFSDLEVICHYNGWFYSLYPTPNLILRDLQTLHGYQFHFYQVIHRV